MITLTDETIINASPQEIFSFLTHIDRLYKIWHPKDHVFCSRILGSIDRVGGIIHFFEWVGRLPLYLIVQTSQVEKNRFLEMTPVFPFSLLHLGKGSFTIEKLSDGQSKLTAYVEIGYHIPVIGQIIDFLLRKLTPIEIAEKHMKEEGAYMKAYLEQG